MKFSKILLLLIIPLVVVALFSSDISSVSTVLLAIKGAITDGNIIKFSGTTGTAEDAGIASTGVSDAVAKKHSQNTDTGTSQSEFYVETGGDNVAVKAHIQSTSDPHNVTKAQVGLSDVENIKVKLDATTAPTVNNDVDEGYSVGSNWYDVTADKGHVCLDNTNGAAVWAETTSQGTTTFTGLTDTPANYTGERGKYVKVNVGEDALEFGTVSGESNTASNIGEEVEIYKQKTGVDLEFRTLKANSAKIIISSAKDEMDIDIGNTAISRPSSWSGPTTIVVKGNPANKTGTIISVEVWANSTMSNCEVATFYIVDGNNLSTRDDEAIGTIISGSKQTFEVNLDVQVGDYIGIYYSEGSIESTSSGTGMWYASGLDRIPCTDQTFTFESGYTQSLYGEGASSGLLDYVKFDVVPSEIGLDDLKAAEDNEDLNASTTAHGLMPKLPFSGDLLSITTVAFNADADTTLYTVPTGKRCVLSYAIVVAAGDAGATTTVSIGQNTAETDFVPANTLSNLDAQYDSVILQPIPNTTPLKTKSYAAATVIEARVASQSGAAGNTIYLFGILY